MTERLELFPTPPAGTDRSQVLPVPHLERFVPLRAGILNLWQYDDQELRFHQGRLLLRGDNGTGKSKALELLLPFLLDADLSPHRLDPFAGSARTMYWNLLEGERRESRVGYVWMELGRRTGGADDDGTGEAAVCWTIGCGLRATRRTRRVDSWYFVTRQRVGLDLQLVSEQRVPLLRDDLARALGDRGNVYETGKEYRDRLDKLFFSLNENRFAALRHLLLQLRRPQLSQKLDPASLSALLAESLPPVDADLIAQLSEGFERLEVDQRELQRTEMAARQLKGFLEVYRSYVRGIARDRAARVRTADSRYHKTAATVRDATAETRQVEVALDDNDTRRREGAEEIAASRGRLRALEQSSAMRAAETLAAKRERAEDLAQAARRAEDDRERAERTVEHQTEASRTATRETQEAEALRDDRLRRTAARATAARLEAAWAAVEDALPRNVDTAAGTFRAAVETRRAALEELQTLDSTRRQAEARWQRLEERREDAAALLAAASERSQSFRRTLEAEQRRLATALEEWIDGLVELLPDGATDDESRAFVERILLQGDEPTAAASAWAAPRRDALVQARTHLEAERDRRATERAETLAERARVEAAEEQGPAPPATRDADRTDRPGAPFYLLVDFRETHDDEARAGVEAALEAAGLLDAWVTPDGRLLDGEVLDTALVAAGAEATGPTLADLLVPVPGHGVDRTIIERLLGSVRLPGEAAGPPAAERLDAPAAISTDGRWRLGPLHGRWAKPRVEHIGASAREAARLRRLAELDRTLVEIGDALTGLDREIATVDRRLGALESEIAAVPPSHALREARHRVGTADEEVERQRGQLEVAQEAASAARRAFDEATRDFRHRGLELGLRDHLGELQKLEARLRELEAGFDQLVDTWRLAARAAERARAAESSLEQAEGEAERARRHARDAGRHATAARAEYETLEETAGREASEVIERRDRERRILEDLEAADERLATEREGLVGRLASARTRLDHQKAALDEITEERERVVDLLRSLATAGFLDLVWTDETDAGQPAPEALADEEPGLPDEPPQAWSLTRTLDVAREIERQTADVPLEDEAADRRTNLLHQRYQQLLTDLGPDFQPSLRHQNDLSVVRVLHNGIEHTPESLLGELRDSAETRRMLLAEHERDLLQRFLLGEMGDHLRKRLRQARELVETMNDLLTACPTASGMVLRLAWRPGGETAPETRAAMELLQRDPALLPASERSRLERFFLDRIDAAREQLEHVPWREHLLHALDYRRWYEFRVQRKSGADTGWESLTRKAHEASSGGEKAVALHLPLFAAAAAHYRSASPEAPRLVMLDEAFAGIDQGMRGRCMKLLVDFDLDFMMTSHDEWGCYEELPGLAIYQLYRDPDFDGVGAVRFLWNGGELRESDGEATRGVARR